MNSARKCPLNVTFSALENDLLLKIQKDFPNYNNGLCCGDPGGFLLTCSYGERAEDVYNFQVRSDDIWIVTFPKSGTTWTQELIWLLANNCDFQTAKSIELDARFPFLENSLVTSVDSSGQLSSSGEKLETIQDISFLLFDEIANLPSPRFIKTHLPLYLLPPKLLDTAKVVYVARNPKDVIVSYYYHHKLFKLHSFKGDMEQFANYFMDNKVLWSPYFAHVLEAWTKRDHPNLLFLFYEDMKAVKDLETQVRKIANYLNKSISKEDVSRLIEHLQFDNFAKNGSVNKANRKVFMNCNATPFIRKGIVGDWKNHFSPELNQQIDQWIANNLQGTDLQFKTQLNNSQ